MSDIAADPVFWQAGAVIAAAAAAIGAWLAARATTNAARASVVAALLESYNEPRMMDGMHAITMFRDAHGSEWVETFRRLRRDAYEQVREVDHGRRRFQGWAYTVFQLRRRWRRWPPGWQGTLSSDLINAVASETAIRFLLDYVRPLDQAIAAGGQAWEMYDYFSNRLGSQTPPAVPITSPKPKGSDEPELLVNEYGNVIDAGKGESVVGEVLGSGDASLANQSFKLKNKPLTYRRSPSVENDQGISSTLEISVDGIRWVEVQDLAGAGPRDQVYIVRQDDEQDSLVIFGDGQHGARLPTGRDNVVASYRFGGG